MAHKLTGDLRKVQTTLESFRAQSQVLQDQTDKATDTTCCAYVKAREDLEQFSTDAKHDMEEIAKQAQLAADKIPTTSTHWKGHPDEYIINSTTVQVRSKKYQEDPMIITCQSQNTLMIMYEHLTELSGQYGIHLTPINKLQRWTNPIKTKATTFPFDSSDFESYEKFKQAYTTMKLALATKLKNGIKFGRNYATAKLIVHDHAIDGYEMIYQLMTTTHPALMIDKALCPQKPKFDRDLHHYMTAYKNWTQFNANRDTPHIYDHDEIADDIINTIKTSRWALSLKYGIERAETKLDCWKNETPGYNTFPTELRFKFIRQTILQYYVERNINPFQETRPAARALHGGLQQQRGRSSYRRRSTSQSRSPSTNRSINSNNNMRDCDICGGKHRNTTIGCPFLLRPYHITNFMHNKGEQEIRQMVENT